MYLRLTCLSNVLVFAADYGNYYLTNSSSDEEVLIYFRSVLSVLYFNRCDDNFNTFS